MSRKTFTLLILLIILLAGGGMAFYYYYLSPTPTSDQDTGDDSSVLFPFGKPQKQPQKPSTPVDTDEPLATTTTPDLIIELPTLRQISITPIAGATTIQNASTTIIRYVDRATGNIFETTTLSPSNTRVTNTTIPKIYEALWNKKGDGVLLRYLKETSIETFYGIIATSTASTTEFKELKGIFLPADALHLTLSPDRSKIFYMMKDGGGSVGFTSALDGSKRQKVFESALMEWSAEWPKDDTIALTTKASAGNQGILYFLNLKNGSLSKAMGNGRSLLARTSSNLAFTLYSFGRGEDVNLGLYERKSDTYGGLGINTLADKCVWSVKNADIAYCAAPIQIPEGRYPDSWYQGLVFFSDALWKINARTKEVEEVIFLRDLAKKDIDAFNLFLDPQEQYIFFTDKNDLTLWSLKMVGR